MYNIKFENYLETVQLNHELSQFESLWLWLECGCNCSMVWERCSKADTSSFMLSDVCWALTSCCAPSSKCSFANFSCWSLMASIWSVLQWRPNNKNTPKAQMTKLDYSYYVTQMNILKLAECLEFSRMEVIDQLNQRRLHGPHIGHICEE